MELNKEFNDLIEEFANITESKIKDELAWTDNLKDNVKVEVSSDSLKLVMPEYGIFVDSGRKPGKQPPINNIYAFCNSKNIPLTAAFPIAKNIGEEGLPAHPFIHIFRDELKGLLKKLGKSVINGITADLN